jgi:hypothetical protein
MKKSRRSFTEHSQEYYTSMGLVDAFYAGEREWFDSFAEEEYVVSY